MILSTSQSLGNVEMDTDGWFCSTLVNKHTSKGEFVLNLYILTNNLLNILDFSFDGFSPIKNKNEKIVNYNKVVTNIKVLFMIII